MPSERAALRLGRSPVNFDVRRPLLRAALLIALLALPLTVSAGKDGGMAYRQRISDRRNAEATALWKLMEKDGFTSASIAALDFLFFSDSKADAEALAKVLSISYTTGVVAADRPGYWYIKGTTRPYGSQVSREQWMSWVKYMVTVGFENNSVFSTWSAYEPKTKKTWSSESIEVP